MIIISYLQKKFIVDMILVKILLDFSFYLQRVHLKSLPVV